MSELKKANPELKRSDIPLGSDEKPWLRGKKLDIHQSYVGTKKRWRRGKNLAETKAESELKKSNFPLAPDEKLWQQGKKLDIHQSYVGTKKRWLRGKNLA